MKIIKPNADCRHGPQAREELLWLMAQPTAAEAPPCPGCRLHAQLVCSSRCEQAPQQLSIDAINYPIETHVVPLVYEMAVMRVVQPCWSCEGHLSPTGELWKIPQVGFYAKSPIYAQLLLRHVSSLELQKQLTYLWHVALSDFGQSWDVVYTLEPNLNYDQSRHAQLHLLQRDLNTLAENLSSKIKSLAQTMLNESPEATMSSSRQIETTS
ncbi:MAG: hypothetical protein FD130_204 [Halothiobacillaceae bacterium]|nr:MAG: hypothetical protein FD130_204 [Halothiobacillaceae bacterium]